jgi:hypothetical protein
VSAATGGNMLNPKANPIAMAAIAVASNVADLVSQQPHREMMNTEHQQA